MRQTLRFVFLVFGALLANAVFPQAEPYRAVIDSDGVQRVRVVGGSYFFRPNHIIVKVKTPVELSASLEPGIAPHTLVLDAIEAGVAIDEKLSTDPKAIVFTAAAVGKYGFYCKNKLLFFKSHRENGMEGILEVVEKVLELTLVAAPRSMSARH